jgi:hypothetical protein
MFRACGACENNLHTAAAGHSALGSEADADIDGDEDNMHGSGR